MKKTFLHGAWKFDIKTLDNNKLLIVLQPCLLKANLECILVLSWEEWFQQCFLIKISS